MEDAIDVILGQQSCGRFLLTVPGKRNECNILFISCLNVPDNFYCKKDYQQAKNICYFSDRLSGLRSSAVSRTA